MKKYCTLIAIALTSLCYGQQQLPQSLTVAVNNSRVEEGLLMPTLDPELSFYSKNYTAIFGKFNYSFDALNFGRKNVYVGGNDRLYFNTANTFIMDMPLAGDNNNMYRYNDTDLVGAVLSIIAGKNIDFAYHAKFGKNK